MAKNTISIGPITAVYPRIGPTPDTKFDELGMYKADGSMPKDKAAPIMARLQEVHKQHVGKPAKASENTMWYMETDEAGEETGNVVFKIRVKNKLRKKDGKLWDRRPKLFDAALKPIDVNPWGGSVYISDTEIYCWDAGGKKGVSLQPMAVQILKLVEGDGAPSAFKKQDGYVAPEAAEEIDDEEDDEDYVPDFSHTDPVGEDDGDY